MRALLSTIICWSIHSLYAQHPVKVEQQLLTGFRKITYWASYKDTSSAVYPYRYDSLLQANETFLQQLLACTTTDHTTITYDFPQLEKEGLIIKTSEDGLFRIYSWNTHAGGTEHAYTAVYQYRAGDKVIAEAAPNNEDGPGCWFSKVYAFKTQEDKTYYLGIYNKVQTRRSAIQGIKCFYIDKNKLVDTISLIKTGAGIQNRVDCKYDMATVAGKPELYALIDFDDDDQQIHFSVVLKNGKVTRRFITYQFTGKYFEEVSHR